MPYKDKEKAKEANRNSYHKYRDDRLVYSKEYYKRTANEKKLKSRAQHIKKSYGLTVEDFNRMWDEQNGRCFICSEPLVLGIGCHIDHDHESNTVRKLLCKGCNNGIGFLKENSELLRKAADYLDSFKGKIVSSRRADPIVITKESLGVSHEQKRI